MSEAQSTCFYHFLKRSLSLTNVKAISQTFNLKEEVSYLQAYENFLYVGTNDSRVLVFQISKSQNPNENLVFNKLSQLYPHCTFVKFIVAIKQFLVVVPHQEQQLIRIWNRQTLQIKQGYKGHQKQITQVLFMKDGKHIASVSYDATARIWDLYEHNQFDKQKYLFDGMYPLLAMQQINANTLALGGDDCCITLWDWKKLQTHCVIFGHPGSVYSLTLYSPYIVSSGGDSQIKIWQIKQNPQASTSKTISPLSHQDGDRLKLIKKIIGQVGQNHFFFKMPQYRILILDSAGKILFINQQLQVTTQKFQIEYYKKIVSAQIWDKYLIFACNSTSKGKERKINIVSLNIIDPQKSISCFNLNRTLSQPANFDQELKKPPKVRSKSKSKINENQSSKATQQKKHNKVLDFLSKLLGSKNSMEKKAEKLSKQRQQIVSTEEGLVVRGKKLQVEVMNDYIRRNDAE